MPTFNYECQCGEKYKELAKADEKVKCPKCGTENIPALPTGGAMQVMETRDAYRGKQVRKNNEGLMKDRMVNHQNKHELAEQIDKFGMNDAVRHGWLKKVKKV
jgi:hypothetical protein